ncbi:OmpA family protein [Marinoscillum furvescens]|uniref:WD40 repeat protein n=1 Tax=Marinoscillum furvescens DSM 4134 TaxID=1122208 RepID=A0A3D9L156_MARFU|nr:OmpA family protein [Marinoscillum furvescens]RED97030.1 WD40 repeat protein [Marinoscillum furvescens DSM 4134]
MRKTLTTIWLLASAYLPVAAQSLTQIQDLAAQYYSSEKYKEAVEYYEFLHEAKPDDRAIQLKLALSLHHSLQYERSEKELLKLLNAGYLNEEALYHYGWLLKVAGAYHEADSVFGLMLSQKGLNEDLRKLGLFQQEGCQLGIRFSQNRSEYTLTPFDAVNSSSHDFGLAYDGDALYALASSRKTRKKQFYDPTYGGVLPDIYAFKTSDQMLSSDKQSFDHLNTEWAEGTGSFSADGQFFYYSSCLDNQPCEILQIERSAAGEWGEPIKLGAQVNKPGYDNKQPAISYTGDTLFFVSNRPGGEGGQDIWMSFQIRKGEWSPAINMGATVNTMADEMSPYYSSTFGGLLFASNGHVGYGGFDIYLAKGTTFFAADVYNVGPPFNSSFDDNYFYIRANQGFVTTNRSQNQFDIYRFDYGSEMRLLKSFMEERALVDLVLKRPASVDLFSFRLEEYEDYHLLHPIEGVKGSQTVRDSSTSFGFKMVTGSAPAQSVIRLTLSDTSEVITKASDEGRFELRLLPDTLRTPTLTAAGQPVMARVSPMGFDGIKYDFERIYFDFDSKVLRNESMETLNDLVRYFDPENVVMVDVYTHTDHFGNNAYNYELSENRGLAIIDYLHNRGLSYEQLRIYPNGEKDLLSSHDSWYSRLFNRRAEIVIYTREPVVFAHPEVFIVRQDLSIDKASDLLQIPAENLREWNNLEAGVTMLKEGHVLRVFDPQHLSPNYNYMIPEDAVGKELISYRVRPGDTIASIARRFGVIEELLIEVNHLPGKVMPGQELVIYKH